MAKKQTAAKTVDAMAQVAATVVAAPQAEVKQALPRGMPQAVKIKEGVVYKTKAQHNMEWWDKIVKHESGSTAGLLRAGVPGHFIGYALRRGYLTEA